MLRLPEGMRDRVRAAAEASGRSMNAEIVQALEQAYPRNADIDQTAAEIVRLADAFAQETNAKKREELKERLRDMNTVLQYEIDRIVSDSFITAEDEDYIPHLG